MSLDSLVCVSRCCSTEARRRLTSFVAADSQLVSLAQTILGDPTPASRLVEYVLASLRTGAGDYDLHLTVLLKGARGCGKRTVVRSVARKTGFHLLEVSSVSFRLGETAKSDDCFSAARLLRSPGGDGDQD